MKEILELAEDTAVDTCFKDDAAKIPDFKIPSQNDTEWEIKNDAPIEDKQLDSTDSAKIPDFKIPPQNDTEWEIKNDALIEDKQFDSADSAKIPDFKIPEDITTIRVDSFFPKNNGEWGGVAGNSTWLPNPDYIPEKSNPVDQTWGVILEKYGMQGIPFKDGYPDFSEIAEESVEIDDFSDNRNTNFNQADNKTAEKWNTEGKDGRTDWKASEVAQYRKDNNLTWHECEDTKTLQLVPSEVHNNISHSGGISVAKKENNEISEANV